MEGRGGVRGRTGQIDSFAREANRPALHRTLQILHTPSISRFLPRKSPSLDAGPDRRRYMLCMWNSSLPSTFTRLDKDSLPTQCYHYQQPYGVEIRAVTFPGRRERARWGCKVQRIPSSYPPDHSLGHAPRSRRQPGMWCVVSTSHVRNVPLFRRHEPDEPLLIYIVTLPSRHLHASTPSLRFAGSWNEMYFIEH